MPLGTLGSSPQDTGEETGGTAMTDRIDLILPAPQLDPHHPNERKPSVHTLLRPLILAVVLMTATAEAQSLDFVLAPGFWPDPHRVSYVSGGFVNANYLADVYGNACGGWIATSADHVMTITRPFTYLRITAESRGDVTLVLYNPRTRERFCHVPTFAAGRSEIVMDYISADTWWIFVGSYRRYDNHAYDLTVSEFSPRAAVW
jgi:hypothetical protein